MISTQALALIAILTFNIISTQQYTSNRVNDLLQVAQLKGSEDADLGRPPSRSGAHGRSDCADSPIAIVPGSDEIDLESEECEVSSISELGYTTAPQPVLWVYLPGYETADLKGIFVLIDNRREVNSWEVNLPTGEGIICFQIPEPLEENNVYRWKFEVKFSDNSSNNPQVGGLIQLAQDVSDHWYDDLNNLVNIERENNLNQDFDWQTLLNNEGLGDLSRVEILSDCLAILNG